MYTVVFKADVYRAVIYSNRYYIYWIVDKQKKNQKYASFNEFGFWGFFATNFLSKILLYITKFLKENVLEKILKIHIEWCMLMILVLVLFLCVVIVCWSIIKTKDNLESSQTHFDIWYVQKKQLSNKTSNAKEKLLHSNLHTPI